jgi:hypothetical protein
LKRLRSRASGYRRHLGVGMVSKCKAVAALVAGILVISWILQSVAASGQPRLDPGADWLSTVNWYRRASGLSTVTANSGWAAGISAHLNYLKMTPASLETGPYASAHTENPASPFYTAAGDSEGRSSDLAFGTSGDRTAIDEWMAAPFHAIGILRSPLQQVAFARDPSTGDAGLDVLHGLTGTTAPTTPVLFPGPDAGVHLSAFGGENPNPLETCGYPTAGLPLIALLPKAPAAGTTADLADDAGASQQVCPVTADNFFSSDPVYGPTGKTILQNDNAVLVIPRNPLRQTRYTARIHQPGQPDISWSFYVTGLAGTAISGGGIMRIHVSDTPGATVLGNLTVTQPVGDGFTTAYPCADGRPLASNNNYGVGQTIPNFAVVRSDQSGDICVFTLASSHLIWDQVAQTTAFTGTNANRIFDSRQD